MNGKIGTENLDFSTRCFDHDCTPLCTAFLRYLPMFTNLFVGGKSQNLQKSHSKSFTTLQGQRIRQAVRRFLARMTLTDPHQEYYTLYAPRTHNLPPPVPLHNFPRGREFYKNIGEPKRIVAPMVDQSELVSFPPAITDTYTDEYRRGESLLDDTERIYVTHP